tara:strand:+ start:1609 stop:2247 length:639 start_codon:yes stop_codon:yes gene_type:complete
MSSNPTFESAYALLLSGEIICEHRFPQEFNLLRMEDQVQRMDFMLAPLNRRIRTTQDNASYLMAYIDPGTSNARSSIRTQFSRVINQLEPLVKWLRLVMDVSGSERPVVPGEVISESKMQTHIEQVPALEAKLESLVKNGLFSSRQSDSKGRLSYVMGKLVDEGYLTRLGSAGSQYRATGKWSWLYDTMGFISVHEELPEPEQRDGQMEFLE